MYWRHSMISFYPPYFFTEMPCTITNKVYRKIPVYGKKFPDQFNSKIYWVYFNSFATLSLCFLLYTCHALMFDKIIMKTQKIILTLALASSLLLNTGVFAQEPPLMSKEEHERVDSLAQVIKKDQVKRQDTRNEEKMSDLKTKKSDAQVKAKEASRVERDANSAAKESKNAYRAEKKAQKSRKAADAQKKKAAVAKEKSDNN